MGENFNYAANLSPLTLKMPIIQTNAEIKEVNIIKIYGNIN
jgi:hypothetical protein